MTEDQDVKRWLRSALADEPPLTLDRDEVFRQGRRKLRNRKLFQAGGAVTGVVAAAVGAVLLTGLVNGDQSVPPAASPTPSSAPPVSATTTSPVLPPSSHVAPPSILPPVDGRAARFTSALLESRVLPEEIALMAWPDETGDVTFRRLHPNVYRLQADVSSPKGEGGLSVLVERNGGKGLGPTCILPETPFDSCEVRTEYGVPMTVAKQKFGNGEIRRFVRAVRPDGTFVTATSTNLAEYLRRQGKGGSYDHLPPVAEETLIAVAVFPEFGTI